MSSIALSAEDVTEKEERIVDSDVVKVKEGWATRLREMRLEKPYRYKTDALALQAKLRVLTRWEIEGTYTLVPGHYFRSY